METPVHDASQTFMNWMPRGACPSAQGVPNGLMYSQEQGQALRSLGLSPQQLDAPLYGTPIAKGHMSQSSFSQVVLGESANSLTKASFNHAQKPIMQLPAFSNSFLGDHRTISQEQIWMPDEAFTSKQGFQKRNPFEQVPPQDLYNGVMPEIPSKQGHFVQRNVSVQELDGMQGRCGLPGLLLEKTAQIESSGLVALDPMEQKILFSKDEDIWDSSFGRPTDIGSGSFGNTFEHPDQMDVFPYSQSGSYSALMQSAVAEVSSNDTDLQEEWSGLTFQNTELSTENQPLNFVESRKQPTGWADNNFQSASFCSKSSPVFNDLKMTSRFPGSPFSLEQRDGPHQDSSHESTQQSPVNDCKWFNSNQQQKSPVEESQQFQLLERLENSWNGQVYPHPISDAYQKSMSVHNNSSKPCNKPKGSTINSSPTSANSTLDNEKTFENCWMGDISGAGYKGRDLDGFLWKTDGNSTAPSFSSAITGLELGQSGANISLVDRENSQGNTFTALSNLSIREASEQVPDSHRIDYKHHVGIHVKHKEIDNIGKDQHQLDNGLQSLSYSYKGADEMFENRQYSYQKENSSSGSYNSNTSQHPVMRRMVTENAWLNASDYRDVTGSCQNLSSQVLGSHGLTSPKQEYFGQLKSTGKVSNSVVGMGKDHLPDFQGNLVELASRGNLGSIISFTGDNLAGFYGCGTAQTRQSREGGTVPHFLSQVPNEQNPVAYNASQWSGLRLAPQLQQQLPSSNHLYSSQSLPQTENTPFPVTSGTTHLRNQLHGQHLSNAAIAYHMTQSTSSSTFDRLPPINLAHSQYASQPMFAHPSGQQSQLFEAVHASQPSDLTGFLVRPPNVWTKIPTQQHLSPDELHKVPSTETSNNSLEAPSLVQRQLKDLNLPKDGNESYIGADSVNSKGYDYEEKPALAGSYHLALSETLHLAARTGNFVQRNEFAASSLEAHWHQPDLEKSKYGSHQDSALSIRDFDFGSSLNSSLDFHQNYSPLHQVQAENNLYPVASKTFMSQAIQQAALITGQPSFYQNTIRAENPMDSEMHAAPSLNSCPSRDTSMESLKSGATADQTVHTSSGTILQRHSSNTPRASNLMENSQSSVQMAPQWFKQYLNLRNGQMLPTYDAISAKLAMEQIPLGQPSENLHICGPVEQMNASANVVHNAWSNAAASLVESEHLSAPKKRKTATSVLLPWHKEVEDGSQTFQNISTAKQVWTRATNCLLERIEEGPYTIDGNFPMVRPKRRLTMTTHLMQQLLRPAPPAILQANAMSNHDCVLYSAAKLVLGDACSLTCMKSDSNDTMMFEEPGRIVDHDFPKALEDFTTRAKKLENDLLRLDKTPSILDIRLECQEMAKYSVMNHFAKFHGRVQAVATETTSSSGTAVTATRPFLQRHVIAHPVPRILPEQMQCLSL